MESGTEQSRLGGGFALSLTGKVALVTGGSRGIGAATVELLRAAGARVVFSYRAAEEQAQRLVEACGGEGVCRALRQELCSAEDGEALVKAAMAVWGRLDCLIVNHGVWPPQDQPITDMSTEQWRRTLGVNLDSVFGLVREAVAQMLVQEFVETHVAEARPIPHAQSRLGAPGGTPSKESGAKGHIVLVASTAAQRGEAFHADYAAHEGALLSFDQEPFERACAAGHSLQLCGAGLGKDGHVGWNSRAIPVSVQESVGPDSAGARRGTGRKSRTDCISVHAVGGVRVGRGVQCERRRGAGGVEMGGAIALAKLRKAPIDFSAE